MTEPDLAQRLADDLDGNFEALVVAMQGPVYRFAYRWCGNAQDAEEIAQDAFVRAYGALQGYDAERIRALKLTPWLMTIAVNVARNRVRGKRLPIDDLDGIDEPLANRSDEPEPVSERNDLSDRLAEALHEVAAALPGGGDPAPCARTELRRDRRGARAAAGDRQVECPSRRAAPA